MRVSVHVFTKRALALLLVSTLFLPSAMATQALGKTRKPSIAEINDAKKKEAEKKAAADRAKAKLNAASNQLKIALANLPIISLKFTIIPFHYTVISTF